MKTTPDALRALAKYHERFGNPETAQVLSALAAEKEAAREATSVFTKSELRMLRQAMRIGMEDGSICDGREEEKAAQSLSDKIRALIDREPTTT